MTKQHAIGYRLWASHISCEILPDCLTGVNVFVIGIVPLHMTTTRQAAIVAIVATIAVVIRLGLAAAGGTNPFQLIGVGIATAAIVGGGTWLALLGLVWWRDRAQTATSA